MNNREEKINALLLDNRFVDWVVNPQSPYVEYWLQWINSNSENAALAEDAKNFLCEFRTTEINTSKEINEHITEQMLINIRESIALNSSLVFMQKQTTQRWYWMAAAVIAGAMVFFGIKFFNQSSEEIPVVQLKKEIQPSPEVIRYNGSEKNEMFFLPDGSRVTLAKGARISYNRLLNGMKRKVFLSGEAFFDVAKNPEKPFTICTKNMLIEVLGTSFKVNASDGKESVVVRTGKVSVYLRGKNREKSEPKILLPQQVCTYSAIKKELVTTAYTGKSKIELKAQSLSGYHFEDAPVDSVFRMLEKMYSLTLHYDRELFKNCFITISLQDEGLEEKLEIITKTIGASFSISDYDIRIEGKGCK